MKPKGWRVETFTLLEIEHHIWNFPLLRIKSSWSWKAIDASVLFYNINILYILVFLVFISGNLDLLVFTVWGSLQWQKKRLSSWSIATRGFPFVLLTVFVGSKVWRKDTSGAFMMCLCKVSFVMLTFHLKRLLPEVAFVLVMKLFNTSFFLLPHSQVPMESRTVCFGFKSTS